MAAQRTILVTAAAGNIGSELVPQLLSHDGIKVVLPTSNAERLKSKLPSTASAGNTAIEQGNIKDAQWIQSLLTTHNVDSVFLCLTGSDEIFTTLNFLDAMQRAGTVKHLVYLSACGDYVSPEGFRNLLSICSAGHVLVKPLIEQKLAYAEFPWTTTVLGPTLFMSNDVRSKGSMLKDGFFDEPLGTKGVSRVNTSDIALAACNAFLATEKWGGKKVMIGSLRRFTDSDVTALWSTALGGKAINMCRSDEAGLLSFENHFESMIGGGRPNAEKSGWGRDLRMMYEMFEKVGFGMSEQEYGEQVKLLGKEPEEYEAWVQRTGQSWI
ncbi:Uu.00g137790.m01.CDS01 [Anthostomella pinea]|uniref:Uu.00g137790.m01.CDS01 n=1 Tax=Anthostomella pinea TaxID=933095 RepID=A0AAI8VPK4_9PEZI|nr:Uu.00g137790.m01.CDS01 [Anthostomella pinea]